MANQVKIRDKGGYIYTIPESATLDTPADISSFTKIKHPNLFIDMRSAYSYTQFIALFRIAISLQPLIQTNFNTAGSTISLQSKNVYWDKASRIVEIGLPLRDFGVRPEHYDDLEKALLDMSRISVTFPQKSALTNKELTATGGLCHVAIERKNKRRQNAHFFFHAQIVQTIINPRNGFSQILKETVEKVNSVYTAKLYFHICRWADKGQWIVSYLELRAILNVDSTRYSSYHDFRKRILKSSANALMNKTNFWFTFYERFPLRSKVPDIIYFTIHDGRLSDQERRDYENRKNRIKDTSSYLGVSARSMRPLMDKITPRNSKYIYDKHNELLAYIGDNANTITDRAAYYRQAMQNIIYSTILKPAEIQTKFDFSNPSN